MTRDELLEAFTKEELLDIAYHAGFYDGCRAPAKAYDKYGEEMKFMYGLDIEVELQSQAHEKFNEQLAELLMLLKYDKFIKEEQK